MNFIFEFLFYMLLLTVIFIFVYIKSSTNFTFKSYLKCFIAEALFMLFILGLKYLLHIVQIYMFDSTILIYSLLTSLCVTCVVRDVYTAK